jgi:hypothetical protein
VVTVRWGGVADGLDVRGRDVMPAASGRGAHVSMQGQVEVTLQVMSLLQEVVQVKALLLV